MSNSTQYEGHFCDWFQMLMEFSNGYDTLDPAFVGLREPKYVFAVYDLGGYNGQAFVLYSADGVTFYHAEGSHCSCYGLEDQWDPTETTREALMYILNEGSVYGVQAEYKDKIITWLDSIPVTGVRTLNLPTVVEAKIGTMNDFGNMAFIESILSTQVDGVEVEVFRGAFNPTYIEVKAASSGKMLRLNLNDLLSDAVKTLMEDISLENQEADVG